METYQIITSAISSIGFPIVCCIALFKYINSTMKEFTQQITANTKMVEKLCNKLDDEKRGEHDE